MEYLTSALIGLGVGIIGTGLGSLLVGLIRMLGEKLPGFLMGLSGGVMLSLVFFDMLPEAVEAAGFGTMLLGTALGGLILWGMHRLLPQVHDHGTEQLGQARSNRELLHTGCFLCLGIALHNLPEGLAIGSGLAAGEGAASGYGVHLALLLTVHNVIEGAALAVPLKLSGMRWFGIFALAVLTGLPIGIGAIVGFLLGGISQMVLGISIAFGAGAMLFVTLREMVPGALSMGSLATGVISVAAGVGVGLVMVYVL